MGVAEPVVGEEGAEEGGERACGGEDCPGEGGEGVHKQWIHYSIMTHIAAVFSLLSGSDDASGWTYPFIKML